MRWDDYILTSSIDESIEAWRSAGDTGKESLLICGYGFDPRTRHAPPRIAAVLPDLKQVVALELGVQGHHQDAKDLADQNRSVIARAFGARLSTLPTPDAEDPRSIGTLYARALVENFDVLNFSHVILDLSGLPSSVSFPIIQLFLNQSVGDANPFFSGDFQVVVSENPGLDSFIRHTGLESPGTIGGFTRLPDSAGIPRVWVPILGEGSRDQLRHLRDYLSPSEVCPVLPFPSLDSRRADNLLLEHRTLLFDELVFEPRNVIYASESNPFDLYRQLHALAERYRRALAPVGGATIIVSEHASKLLSVAAALVGHECDIVLADVRPTGYELDKAWKAVTDPAATVHTAWLTGRPYRKSE
jgi:hypothetical protein